MGNKKDYSERQTEYVNAMKQFGLKRGLKNSTRMHHGDIKKLYRDTIRDVVDLLEAFAGETAEEYRKRIR